MINVIMTALDKKARAYCTPFFQAHADVGLRAFRIAVNDPTHPMALHPEDYSLWVIGTFDDSTGVITPQPTPVHVAEGINLVRNLERSGEGASNDKAA